MPSMPLNTNVNDLNSILKFPQPNAASPACLLHESVVVLVEGMKSFIPTQILAHSERQFHIVPQVLFESIFSDILIVNFRFHRSNKNEPEEISVEEKLSNISFSPYFFSLRVFYRVGRVSLRRIQRDIECCDFFLSFLCDVHFKSADRTFHLSKTTLTSFIF